MKTVHREALPGRVTEGPLCTQFYIDLIFGQSDLSHQIKSDHLLYLIEISFSKKNFGRLLPRIDVRLLDRV